jgi:hypothetical protein
MPEKEVSIKDVSGDNVTCTTVETDNFATSLFTVSVDTAEKRVLLKNQPFAVDDANLDWYLATYWSDASCESIEVVSVADGPTVMLWDREQGPTEVPDAFLRNDQALVLSENVIALWDLPSASVTTAIDLSPFCRDSARLDATDGLVLVDCYTDDGKTILQVDTNSSTITDVPAPDDSWGSITSARLGPGFVVATTEKVDSGTQHRIAVVRLDDGATEWRQLCDYGVVDVADPWFLAMADVDEARVLFEYQEIEYSSSEQVDQVTCELHAVDVNSGERTVIAASGPKSYSIAWALFTDPKLDNGKSYWIDPLDNALLVHDFEAGADQRIDLGL